SSNSSKTRPDLGCAIAAAVKAAGAKVAVANKPNSDLRFILFMLKVATLDL
ncbi:MAG: hypothetical protein RLZZ89_698, partial [Cyanobacteriota bacterium]